LLAGVRAELSILTVVDGAACGLANAGREKGVVAGVASAWLRSERELSNAAERLAAGFAAGLRPGDSTVERVGTTRPANRSLLRDGVAGARPPAGDLGARVGGESARGLLSVVDGGLPVDSCGR
jgi:hypothetical protein